MNFDLGLYEEYFLFFPTPFPLCAVEIAFEQGYT